MKIISKNFIFLIVSLQLISCSSIRNIDSKRSSISSTTWTNTIYGCIALSLLAGVVAKKASPNRESDGVNMLTFGSLGCALGGTAAGAINHMKEQEGFRESQNDDNYLYINHATKVDYH